MVPPGLVPGLGGLADPAPFLQPVPVVIDPGPQQRPRGEQASWLIWAEPESTVISRAVTNRSSTSPADAAAFGQSRRSLSCTVVLASGASSVTRTRRRNSRRAMSRPGSSSDWYTSSAVCAMACWMPPPAW